jgi:hypothetical protein
MRVELFRFQLPQAFGNVWEKVADWYDQRYSAKTTFGSRFASAPEGGSRLRCEPRAEDGAHAGEGPKPASF